MDKNRIHIIYPPISKQERYSSDIGNAGGDQIPLGIYYLASTLLQHGFQVKVTDAEALNLNAKQLTEQILAFEPAYVGISSTTVAFHRALELATEIKAMFPDIIIILGGPHVSANPEHAMASGFFDYGVLGEGEITLPELLKALNHGSGVENIHGLAFKTNNGMVTLTEKRAFIGDLDMLPFPAYHLIEDISLYTPPPSNYKTLPVINIITSRGCPGKCTFCDKNIFGNTCRRRSAENIVEEIKLLNTQYHVNEIAFVDDTFLLDKKRVYRLFELLDAEGIHFPWTCMSRINDVTDEYLLFLKKHGCWHISFGIESGNEEILKLIRKHISLQKTENVIALCRKYGIKTKGFFIIGHPGDTLQTIDETIRFACRLKLDDIVVTLNTPIPGSPQYSEADAYGSLDKADWNNFNYWRPVFVPIGLDQGTLLRKHREIYRRFYLRPSKLWRYFLSFFGKGGGKRFITILKASLFLLKKSS